MIRLCIYIYIYYVHPELRIRDYRFDSEKGAGRFRGSREEAKREHEGARESIEGAL